MNEGKPDKVGFSIANFIQQQSFGGFLLIFVTLVALAWANSPWHHSYHHLWHEVEFGFILGEGELRGVLHQWVNDFLMAIFFFVIGLEIKREVMVGQLSSMKNAIMPVAAAVGGMVVPALIYVAVNYDNPQDLRGWGIPMATDIAFALGLMSLLGNKVPTSLKVFLTALAIADDLGAIMVIALFYTESIDLTEMVSAAIFMAILIGGNKLGIRNTGFYAIVGFLGVWLSFIFSGVHATIAGVLVAMTIPANPKITGNEYIRNLVGMLRNSRMLITRSIGMLEKEEVHVLSKVIKVTKKAESPSQKLEHVLHPFSSYFILPLFALANAGVHIEGSIMEMLFHPVSLGIIAGLVLGKFLGVSLVTKLMIWFKIAGLPEGTRMIQIYGAALLAGIGFTMSIFISDLAFESPKYIQIAKVGVFAASVISAILGMMVLSYAGRGR